MKDGVWQIDPKTGEAKPGKRNEKPAPKQDKQPKGEKG